MSSVVKQPQSTHKAHKEETSVSSVVKQPQSSQSAHKAHKDKPFCVLCEKLCELCGKIERTLCGKKTTKICTLKEK